MPDSPSSNHRLLLVEDDPLVRETISLMLEDDYEVVHAESVDAAVGELGRADGPRVELVLLDCLLPNGNVRDVLSAADRGSVPVVLISGDPNQASAVDPARAFLPKPFSHAILLSVLHSARR